MDIVIYMNEKDFLHKTGQPEGRPITAYWSMGRIPRHFNQTDEDNDLIWLAYKGFIRGSVKCEEFNPEDVNGETIVWDSQTFTLLLEVVNCKPFRGFRYRWWEED